MRLIDADALLEQYGLKDATKYGNENAEQQHKSYSTLMMYEIADMIYDAPTISVSANWTPCSVALPEKSDRFEVTWLDKADGSRYSDMATFFSDTKEWAYEYENRRAREHTEEQYVIVAWKERSEPYRGEA